MTSGMIDSKAVFLARMQSAGLEQDAVDRLIAGGLDTLAKLAFLAPVSPSSGDDSALFTALDGIMRYDVDTPMPALVKAVLRRIWFESHATAIAEVKAKMERGDESHPRKLPMPEREERRSKQQDKLTGIVITGVHEPSNALMDLIHTMKEDEQIRYISPEVCTYREQELQGVKKESFLQSDSGGRLKQVNREIAIEADISNSYKLRLAFQRRALAMDQMELADYHKMEAYHEFLFDLVLQTPPPGFSSVSIPQILAADKLVWNHMSNHCRRGISRRPDGKLPIHDALDEALKSPFVSAALQPLPKSALPQGKGYQRDNFRKTFQSEPYENKAKGKPFKGSGKPFKGSGKGKYSGKSSIGNRMPQSLVGGHSVSKAGQRICYGFNLQSCEVQGKQCPKGLHVCCMCESPDHHFGACPKKS
jgi:hypothetical protein